jgi:hypothetical protein
MLVKSEALYSIVRRLVLESLSQTRVWNISEADIPIMSEGIGIPNKEQLSVHT